MSKSKYFVRSRCFDESCRGEHYDAFQTQKFSNLEDAKARFNTLSLHKDDDVDIGLVREDGSLHVNEQLLFYHGIEVVEEELSS